MIFFSPSFRCHLLNPTCKVHLKQFTSYTLQCHCSCLCSHHLSLELSTNWSTSSAQEAEVFSQKWSDYGMYFLLKTLPCVPIALHSSPHKSLFTYSATLHIIHPLFMKFHSASVFTLWRICAIGPLTCNPPHCFFWSWFSCLRIQLKCDLLRDIPLPLH